MHVGLAKLLSRNVGLLGLKQSELPVSQGGLGLRAVQQLRAAIYADSMVEVKPWIEWSQKQVYDLLEWPWLGDPVPEEEPRVSPLGL